MNPDQIPVACIQCSWTGLSADLTKGNCPQCLGFARQAGGIGLSATVTPAFQKHDDGKVQLSLIAPHFEWELGVVLTKGAEKYGRSNYLKGAAWSRYADAAKRHINQWLRGEDKDDGPGGTGCSHLANATACLMILSESQRLGIGTDDRTEVTGRTAVASPFDVAKGWK